MSLNWRYLLVVVVSVGLHLGLLCITLSLNAGPFSQNRYFVGHVVLSRDNFAPEKLQPQRITPEPQETRTKPLKVSQKIKEWKPLVQPKVASRSKRSEHLLTPQKDVSPKEVEPLLLDPIEEQAVSGESVESVINDHEGVEGSVTPMPDKLAIVTPQPEVSTSVATIPVPRYIDNPKPIYPEVARRKGWTGVVRLLIRVSESGDVERLSVQDSSGYSALDRAARRSVRLWSFTPATENGRNVASDVIVPVEFRLPGVINPSEPKAE